MCESATIAPASDGINDVLGHSVLLRLGSDNDTDSHLVFAKALQAELLEQVDLCRLAVRMHKASLWNSLHGTRQSPQGTCHSVDTDRVHSVCKVRSASWKIVGLQTIDEGEVSCRRAILSRSYAELFDHTSTLQTFLIYRMARASLKISECDHTCDRHTASLTPSTTTQYRSQTR